MADMLDSQQERFVRTDPDNGLSHRDYLVLQSLLQDDHYALENATCP